MNTNITFRIDSPAKARMTEICNQLGMTPSMTFNIFANTFVRANSMPFPVRLDASSPAMTWEHMLTDADDFLEDYAQDYKKMAE